MRNSEDYRNHSTQSSPASPGAAAIATPDALAADPLPTPVPSRAPEGFYLNADARDGEGVNGKPSLTIDGAALQLTRESTGWSGGGPQTVTYAYRADAPFQMPEGSADFSRFSAAQITEAELSLRAWSDVANISFQRVGAGTEGDAAYSNRATILFGNYASGQAAHDAAAFALFPGSRGSASPDGDVWVNINLDYNVTPVVLGFGGQVLTHELGHAIGLSHPSNYNADASLDITYAENASYFEDSRQYTVMTYFGGIETGARLPGFSAAPLLDDIAAVQRLYGANTTTRTGDTIYGFHSNTDLPWLRIASPDAPFQVAIWDAGGRDTIDLSDYGAVQKIDLRQGFFSDVGGNVGNLTIAKGADIENAIGGSGADTITGNALDNVLSGNGGGGMIMAGAGADTVTESSGTSYLRGEDGDDSISGGIGFDDINGNQGNDTADGGDGADWVVGGKDNDRLSGGAGDDLILGNLGNDSLTGGTGADVIRGGQANDTLSGGDGDDYVSGDRGDDTVVGGAGADIFHSFSGADLDRVLDFSLAEGDRVRLDPGTTWRVMQSGADTEIDFDGGGQMILVGIDSASLTGDWIGIL